SGTVVGSTGTSYDAYIAIFSPDEYVADYGCTCPAHTAYSGMCKHTVALALKYLSHIGAMHIVETPSASMNAKTASKPKAIPYDYTSPQIEQVVARYAGLAQRAARMTPDAEDANDHSGEPPVELSCTFFKGADSRSYYSRYYDDMWSLGLKISRGKSSYAVKRISDLVNAWQEGTLFAYGKNLSFVHRRSAFSDKANELLEFLAPLVNAQLSLYAAQESRSYYKSPSFSTKTLPLSSEQLAEVLGIAEGTKVVFQEKTYNYYEGRSTKKHTLPVRPGEPKLQVVIAQSDAGDFDLAIYPGTIECVRGTDSLFLMDDSAVWKTGERFARELGVFCETLLPCTNVLHIRNQDMPAFCASVLPALRELTDVSFPEGIDDVLPPVPEFTFRIGVEDGYIVCHTQVDYGSETIGLFEPVREDQVSRDVAREIAVQQTVRIFFPQGNCENPDYAHPISARYHNYYNKRTWAPRPGEDGYGQPNDPCFAEDDDAAYYLLFADGLRELSHFGTVMLSERLRNVTVRQAPSVNVEASIKSGLLDIQVSSPDLDPAALMAYLASYQRKQRYVRLANGDIFSLDGSVSALVGLADGLGISAADLVEGAHDLPANRTLFVDAMIKRATGIRFERNAAFRKIVRDFEAVAEADFDVPANLAGVLRPYQIEGFKWLSTLGTAGFGGILADDMGLGKTLQLIAYFLARKEAGEQLPALVVCPASLVYNWLAEIARFAPELDAVAVVGPKGMRTKTVAQAKGHDVLVTSYDLLKRDVDAYAEQEFSCVALDEAQYVKNSATKAAKSAKQLKAQVRFALTGTPIENRLAELWSIFDFLMPGVLGSLDSFNRRFSTPIVNGDEAVAKRLQSLVGPFILRRLKADVLSDLPDKNESVVFARMEGEQEKLYRSNADKLALMLQDQMPEEFAGMKLKILAELTKLRQLCCDPSLLYEDYKGGSAKLETCIDLVRTAVEGGHAVLLFSQFTSMLDIIAPRLVSEGIAHLMLTGATSKEERVRLVQRFQDGEAQVFLISLKAGGVGLNLTAADIVIHYDPWWNLAAQNQATDRAHRIGQTKDVTVLRLIAKDTIEERIVEMQDAKQDLAESVIGGEAVGSTAISRENVLALLESASA
ncbi:MAG: DEAD/DEAH box helicase, partial [Eggerthellaceae bacterium]|nr:DEAD/DEAH box helicase [Eggerthellaceae bacterium]